MTGGVGAFLIGGGVCPVLVVGGRVCCGGFVGCGIMGFCPCGVVNHCNQDPHKGKSELLLKSRILP